MMERRETKTQVKTSSDAGDEHLLNVSVESLLSNDDVALEFECNSSNSIAFMRLKYEELRQAYSKSMRRLFKKNHQLKMVLQEAEIEKFKNAQLMKENAKLRKTTEEVCFRYFHLMDQRSDEQAELRAQIQALEEKCAKMKRDSAS